MPAITVRELVTKRLPFRVRSNLTDRSAEEEVRTHAPRKQERTRCHYPNRTLAFAASCVFPYTKAPCVERARY